MKKFSCSLLTSCAGLGISSLLGLWYKPEWFVLAPVWSRTDIQISPIFQERSTLRCGPCCSCLCDQLSKYCNHQHLCHLSGNGKKITTAESPCLTSRSLKPLLEATCWPSLSRTISSKRWSTIALCPYPRGKRSSPMIIVSLSLNFFGLGQISKKDTSLGGEKITLYCLSMPPSQLQTMCFVSKQCKKHHTKPNPSFVILALPDNAA